MHPYYTLCGNPNDPDFCVQRAAVWLHTGDQDRLWWGSGPPPVQQDQEDFLVDAAGVLAHEIGHSLRANHSNKVGDTLYDPVPIGPNGFGLRAPSAHDIQTYAFHYGQTH